jgi:DNA polymerase III alpha subunit
MRLDKYSNPVFNEQDLFEAIYSGFEFNPSDTLIVDNRSDDIKNLENQLGFKFLEPYEPQFEIKDYDAASQQLWNMPGEYRDLDIESWIRDQCPPWDPEATRVEQELEAYKARNMLDLLRWLKYFVDTCSKENIVWGVGRGSSVASYILFLIGVHKVNSIKYKLDWQEFLR